MKGPRMYCPEKVRRLPQHWNSDLGLDVPSHQRAEWERGMVQRFSRPLYRCSPSEDDKFAPLTGHKRCRDVNGRWRLFHSWDKDGVCIFCDRKRK